MYIFFYCLYACVYISECVWCYNCSRSSDQFGRCPSPWFHPDTPYYDPSSVVECASEQTDRAGSGQSSGDDFSSAPTNPLIFSVKTDEEVKLTFSPIGAKANPSYEITLGGNGNTESSITKSYTDLITEAQLIHGDYDSCLLDGGKMDEFHLTWKGKMVTLAKLGEEPFLKWYNLTFPISHYGLGTLGGTGKWKIKGKFLYVYTADEKKYNFFPAPASREMTFKVLADKQARIALINGPLKPFPMVEIIIDNIKSYIRHTWTVEKGKVEMSANTNLLRGNSLTGFWIAKTDGCRIAVGRWGEIIEFIHWTDSDPIDTNYYSIRTGVGSTGAWKFEGNPNYIFTPDSLKYQLTKPFASPLRFQVTATMNVYVALTPEDKVDLPFYEILIGGAENSLSSISSFRIKAATMKEEKNAVPFRSKFVEFWVTWDDGWVQVGHKGNNVPFLQWDDPEPLTINYFGISTCHGSPGVWKFTHIPKEIVTLDDPEYMFFDAPATPALDFSVCAKSDARIVLSNNESVSEESYFYEIVIGGENDTKSTIREKRIRAKLLGRTNHKKRGGGGDDDDDDEESIFEGGCYDTFIINWGSFGLTVHQNDLKSPLLETNEPVPSFPSGHHHDPISYFGVSTQSSKGRWKIKGQTNFATNKGEYKFFPVSGTRVRFKVSAPRDVHVVLTLEPRVIKPYYHIIIGGWDGRTSALIHDFDDSSMAHARTGETDFPLLSGFTPVTFLFQFLHNNATFKCTVLGLTSGEVVISRKPKSLWEIWRRGIAYEGYHVRAQSQSIWKIKGREEHVFLIPGKEREEIFKLPDDGYLHCNICTSPGWISIMHYPFSYHLFFRDREMRYDGNELNVWASVKTVNDDSRSTWACSGYQYHINLTWSDTLFFTRIRSQRGTEEFLFKRTDTLGKDVTSLKVQSFHAIWMCKFPNSNLSDILLATNQTKGFVYVNYINNVVCEKVAATVPGLLTLKLYSRGKSILRVGKFPQYCHVTEYRRVVRERGNASPLQFYGDGDKFNCYCLCFNVTLWPAHIEVVITRSKKQLLEVKYFTRNFRSRWKKKYGIGTGPGIIGDWKIDDTTRVTTDSNEFKYFQVEEPIGEGGHSLKFLVNASRDARVVIFDGHTLNASRERFFISITDGDVYSHNVIGIYNASEVLCETISTGSATLRGSESHGELALFDGFEIRWTKEWSIKVFKEHFERPFVKGHDKSPMFDNIKYFGIATGPGEPGVWRIQGSHRLIHTSVEETAYQIFELPKESVEKRKLWFRVRAEGSVRVLLTSDKKLLSRYEIMIGEEKGSFSSISRFENIDVIRTVEDTSQLLRGDGVLLHCHHHSFWVDWTAGTVSAGIQYDDNPLITWTDPEPLKITHYGVNSSLLAHWLIKGIRDEVNTTNQSFYFEALATRIEFKVRTEGDISVPIAAGLDRHDAFYEVIFGRQGGMIIAKTMKRSTKIEKYTPKILPGIGNAELVDFDPLSLRWNSSGTLTVGRPSEKPALTWQDPEPFKITHYGIATGRGVVGKWKLVGQNKLKTTEKDNIEYDFYKSPPHGVDFRVKASHDIRIALVGGLEQCDPLIEVWLNTTNRKKDIFGKNIDFIRRIVAYSTIGHEVVIPNILEQVAYKTYDWIWVSWTGGKVCVGKEGKEKPALSWQDPDPIIVNFYGIKAGNGVNATWIIEGSETLIKTYNKYKFYPVTGTVLRFKVQAKSDVHVALATLPEKSIPMYEVLIGIKNNTKTIIRQLRTFRKYLAKEVTRNIQNPDKMSSFWISWDDVRNLHVGRVGESKPFMSCFDPDPFPINFFSMEAQGEWLTKGAPRTRFCYYREWRARSNYKWIEQRGCYNVTLETEPDLMPFQMLEPYENYTCLTKRFEDAEYKLCLCSGDFCNEGSRRAPLQIIANTITALNLMRTLCYLRI